MGYDEAGRIDSKSDTGSFSYFTGRHAVKQVTGTRAASYAYDANGNMTCRLGTGSTCSGVDAITWTSFNKPVQINKGTNRDIFSYGPDQSRFKRV